MKLKIAEQETAQKIAGHLLEIGAVKFQPEDPFTWASGWKSPIYCDNRLTLSYPAIRDHITESYIKLIEKHLPGADVIAGVATAGIPQAALIAKEMNLPLVYVRSKAKGHGMTNTIEGELKAGQNCVVIEDLVSTGGSSIKAAMSLRQNGANILGLAAIFTYGFKEAVENFLAANIETAFLCDYSTMLPYAIHEDYVKDEHLQTLMDWRENPGSWGV